MTNAKKDPESKKILKNLVIRQGDIKKIQDAAETTNVTFSEFMRKAALEKAEKVLEALKTLGL